MIQVVLLVVVIALLLEARLPRAARHKSSPNQAGRSIVIDTNILIDGRIIGVVESGMLNSDSIVVSKRVLEELQLLADGKDSYKRKRAKYGLSVLSRLQESAGARIVVDERPFTQQSTDNALLALTKDLNASLLTADGNLAQVAHAQSIRVINLHTIAQIMRPNVRAGDQIRVKILQKGEEKGQGVGYLDDGTMTVVENASRMKSRTITAMVDRVIQTDSGRMIFATYKKHLS